MQNFDIYDILIISAPFLTHYQQHQLTKISLFMKKILFSAAICCASLMSKANIVVKDITDFTFTPGSSLNFDFNSDNTPEFTFSEFDGAIETYFDHNNVNFVGCGTLDTGSWDVIKSLNIGININSSSNFSAQGDAYINPFWASANEMFPNGDTYIGTTFKIGNNRHYGWILVNSNNGTITVKSYAYNDVPNQGIKTGQTLGVSESNNNTVSISIFPNPAQESIQIKTEEKIIGKTILGSNGQIISKELNGKNTIDVQYLAPGLYFLEIETGNREKTIKKFIKK